jgi:hypothetical protein
MFYTIQAQIMVAAFSFFFSKFVTLSQNYRNPCVRLLNFRTLEFRYQSFSLLFLSLAMIFQGGIYRVLLEFLMGSNIN